MATYKWIGAAKSVAQVNTITPANVNIGNTFTVTINNKAYTFTATAATVANVTAGLTALLQASDEGEFSEVTWADGTTAITGTARTPGTPFTQTSSASGGTATLTTSTTTANVSPNDVNNSANWVDTGGSHAVPGNNDTVIFDDGNVDAMWNLDALAAVTGLTFYRYKGYTGKIGLPTYNQAGQYYEYRATEFSTTGGTYTIEQNPSDQPGQIKVFLAATAGTVTVNGSVAAPLGREQMWLRGTGNNTVNLTNASLAVVPTAGLSSTVTTLKATNSTFRGGLNVTLTTINNYNSIIETWHDLTTLNHYGANSTTYVKGAAVITNAPDLKDGTLFYMSTGTLPAPTVGTDATVDFTLDTRARSVTGSVTLRKGATWRDPYGTVSSVTFATDASIEEVTLQLPAGKTIAIS